MVNLDIGCGGKNKEGYIGIDIKKTDAVDYVVSATDLKYEDNKIENIYTRRCVQHIKRARAWKNPSNENRNRGRCSPAGYRYCRALQSPPPLKPKENKALHTLTQLRHIWTQIEGPITVARTHATEQE